MIEDGNRAPDFKLPDEAGNVVQLSKLKGRAVVVYFYPKDDTSGCTQEGKDFSCLAEEFAGAGAEILGISPDSAASHQKFKSKYGLSLRLLADEKKEVAEAYGVWVEKSMYGRKFFGNERTTFVIDGDGVVREVLRKVKPAQHDELVLGALAAA